MVHNESLDAITVFIYFWIYIKAIGKVKEEIGQRIVEGERI